MSEQENVSVVQGMYAAFGRGDLPAVLESLAEDVEWVGYGPRDIPLYGPRRGRDEVAQFFSLADALEIEVFETQEYIAQGDKVAALFHEKGKVKATGRPYEIRGVDVHTLRNGEIVQMRGYWDSASLAAAWA